MAGSNVLGYFASLFRRSMDTIRSWGFGALFVWVFLFAGIATLGWGVWGSVEALNSRSWPVVEGRILQSEVASNESNSDSGSTTMYYAYLRYTYSVDGEELTSEKVNLGDYSFSDSRNAERITARYPVGTAVRVYYDPAHPGMAVLEPGLTGGLSIPLMIGTIFSLVGGAMAYFYFRTLRKASNEGETPA